MRMLLPSLALAVLTLGPGCNKSVDVLETELETALTLRDGTAALVAVDELLARRPGDADLLADRGRALELKGRIDAAIKAYGEACKAAPARADLGLLRGAANLRNGKVDKALPDLRVATQANPEDGYAGGLYSTALFQTRTSKGLVEAEEIASAWLAKDPRNVGALVTMASIAHQRGQMTAARELTGRAREVAPQDPLVAQLTATVGL